MRPVTESDPDDRFDFSDEEPTHPDRTSMSDLMETLGSEDGAVPSLITDRPTKPIRPVVRWNEKEQGG